MAGLLYQFLFNWGKNKNTQKKFKILKKKNKLKDIYLNYNSIKKENYFKNNQNFRNLQKSFLLKQAKNKINKVNFIDHHSCHAYYAAYAPEIKEKKSGILTIDSEGDGLNQTFWIFDKKKNILKRVNYSSQWSCKIYRFITLILKNET